jgi:hypothetical protein
MPEVNGYTTSLRTCYRSENSTPRVLSSSFLLRQPNPSRVEKWDKKGYEIRIKQSKEAKKIYNLNDIQVQQLQDNAQTL